MAEDPRFDAIWQAIKGWDIADPARYGGYCGATGEHVRIILAAFREPPGAPAGEATPEPDPRQDPQNGTGEARATADLEELRKVAERLGLGSTGCGCSFLTMAEGAKAIRSLIALVERPTPPPTDQSPGDVRERVRHVKRGTEYEVLGVAQAQVSSGYEDYGIDARLLRDDEDLVIYRCVETGKLWCRFTDEFRDGRFETIAAGYGPNQAPSDRGQEVDCG